MKRICVVWLTILLLLCAGCASPEEVPEESVVRLWTQRDSADSTMIEIFASGDENERWPCFSVENAEGQKLTFDQENAIGTMPLIYHRLTNWSKDEYLATYAIPLSEEYAVSFQQEQSRGQLVGNEGALDGRHYFYWDATDLQRLEYQVNTLTATGVNMTYELWIGCNRDGDEPVNFRMIGQSESQVVLKPQEDYFLVKSEDSPCMLEYSFLDGGFTPLGVSSAGQWSKISRAGDAWVMEPLAG